MGCGCVRNDNFDNLIRNFYDGLIIKNKEINDVFELIKIKKSNTSKINKKKWEIFEDNLLLNPKFMEQSKKFFNYCLEESRKKYDKNEGYFFISILFFCQSNFEDFIKIFISCCHSQAGLKEELFNENEKNFIKNEKLKKILLFYLHLITNYCVDFIKELDDNPELFSEEFNKIFDEESVEKFFNENIFENYFDVENVEIEKFFKDKLNLLKNDNLIKTTIYNYYILKTQKKNK
jgi:hypothetical protein